MNMRQLDSIRHTVRRLEALAELLLLTLAYYLVWRACYRGDPLPPYYGLGKFTLAGVYLALLWIVMYNDDGLKFGYLKLTGVLLSQWVSLLIVNVVTYFQLCLIANALIPVLPMLALTALDAAISLVCCYLYTLLYHSMHAPRKMLMIYGDKRSVTLKVKMDSRSDKYKISEMISAAEDPAQIKARIRQYRAVVICDVPAEIRNDILKFCYANDIRTYITPKVSDVIIRGAERIHLFDTPLVLVKAGGLNFEQRFLKRAVDLLLCGIALLILWPLMLVIAIAIKLEDGGPVFYKQRRVTRYDKEFDILKFRSMIVNAEQAGISIPATERDPRITKVGRVIRATRLDELPQLLNILKGDMSIVGPRPERVEHVRKYAEEIPEFGFRTKVKGGLTGYAQVFGKYNTSAYDKLKLDLMYIEQYSLLLDFKLILMTISVLFKKESTEGFDMAITPEEVLKECAEAEGDDPQGEEKTPAQV